jgi:hypothetical protein
MDYPKSQTHQINYTKFCLLILTLDKGTPYARPVLSLGYLGNDLRPPRGRRSRVIYLFKYPCIISIFLLKKKKKKILREV